MEFIKKNLFENLDNYTETVLRKLAERYKFDAVEALEFIRSDENTLAAEPIEEDKGSEVEEPLEEEDIIYVKYWTDTDGTKYYLDKNSYLYDIDTSDNVGRLVNGVKVDCEDEEEVEVEDWSDADGRIYYLVRELGDVLVDYESHIPVGRLVNGVKVDSEDEEEVAVEEREEVVTQAPAPVPAALLKPRIVGKREKFDTQNRIPDGAVIRHNSLKTKWFGEYDSRNNSIICNGQTYKGLSPLNQFATNHYKADRQDRGYTVNALLSCECLLANGNWVKCKDLPVLTN